MNTKIDKLLRKVTWKKCLVFLIISQSIFILMNTWTFPHISAQAGGLDAFDMRPLGYSIDEARNYLENISDSGISFYRNVQLLLDIPYPALMCLFYSCSIILLYRASKKRIKNSENRPARWLSGLLIIPIIGMLADYAENICVSIMLVQKQNVSDSLIMAANVFTLIKSMSTIVCWSVLIIFVIVVLFLIIRKRQNDES